MTYHVSQAINIPQAMSASGNDHSFGIPLAHGLTAIVDAEDFDFVSQFSWCVRRAKSSSYVFRCDGRKKRYLHRELLSAPKNLLVDHINHDGLDNRRKNLRICTPLENVRNMRPAPGKLKGANFYPPNGKWQASIKVNGEKVCLGFFNSEVPAAIAYDIAARKYFGEFACLNFPDVCDHGV